MSKAPLPLLGEVLRALGPLADELVFIGGTVVPLYFQEAPAEAPRVTDDVDCVLEAVTLPEFYRFEERLRRLGCRPDLEEGAPLCRWEVGGNRVDFMPQDPGVLGFGSRWYVSGRRNAEWAVLPDGERLRIFSLPYFLAAKLEAHAGRGGPDPRLSRDLEDVLMILGSRLDLPALAEGMDPEPRAYLVQECSTLLRHPGLDETLDAVLEHRQRSPERRKRVRAFLEAVSV